MNSKKFLDFKQSKRISVNKRSNNNTLIHNQEFVFGSRDFNGFFWGFAALIRAKVQEFFFSEKKNEIKKGAYFSLAGIICGLGVERIFSG